MSDVEIIQHFLTGVQLVIPMLTKPVTYNVSTFQLVQSSTGVELMLNKLVTKHFNILTCSIFNRCTTGILNKSKTIPVVNLLKTEQVETLCITVHSTSDTYLDYLSTLAQQSVS